MGLRTLSGGSNCPTSETYEQWKERRSNPNPAVFKITCHYTARGNTAIYINYPNCKNYEGDKIIVFRNMSFREIQKLREIDPHFTENGKIFARFAPTDDGWTHACWLLSVIKN